MSMVADIPALHQHKGTSAHFSVYDGRIHCPWLEQTSGLAIYHIKEEAAQ